VTFHHHWKYLLIKNEVAKGKTENYVNGDTNFIERSYRLRCD
jgi:hypothetical protein